MSSFLFRWEHNQQRQQQKKISIMQSDDKREKLVDDESNSELNGWVENTKKKILASSAPGFCIFIHSLGCRPKREKKNVCACINAIFIFFMFAGPKEHRKSKKQQQQPVTTRYVCCAYFYCVFILGGRMGRKKRVEQKSKNLKEEKRREEVAIIKEREIKMMRILSFSLAAVQINFYISFGD